MSVALITEKVALQSAKIANLLEGQRKAALQRVLYDTEYLPATDEEIREYYSSSIIIREPCAECEDDQVDTNFMCFLGKITCISGYFCRRCRNNVVEKAMMREEIHKENER